jgi:hypothetical protein
MALQTELVPGETVLKDGRANFQRGAEAVGGRLYLTDRRLIFESHTFNIQIGTTEIPLAEIAGLRKVWTKFLGVVPIAPNSIAVTTTDGSEHRIVCPKRGEWIEALHARTGAAA